MPATVHILSYHAALPDAGTAVEGGSVRLKTADNDTVDANNPIAIPGAGTVYSYMKNIRFSAATTPSNLINNLKFYTDGANGFGTGVGLKVFSFTPLTGTASSGTTTTLTTSGLTASALVGKVLEITAGTNSGSARRITVNTTTVITVNAVFGSAIDNTSVFRVWYIDPINNAQTQWTLDTMVDAFTYTSGSALAMAGSIANPNTGAFGDGLYMQMSVASTATQGTTGSETVTYSYDES